MVQVVQKTFLPFGEYSFGNVTFSLSASSFPTFMCVNASGCFYLVLLPCLVVPLCMAIVLVHRVGILHLQCVLCILLTMYISKTKQNKNKLIYT